MAATNGGMFIVKATGLNIYGAKSDDIEVTCGTNEVVSPTTKLSKPLTHNHLNRKRERL